MSNMSNTQKEPPKVVRIIDRDDQGVYQLTGLSANELATLFVVLEHVGGDIETSWRRHVETISQALDNAGFNGSDVSTMIFTDDKSSIYAKTGPDIFRQLNMTLR